MPEKRKQPASPAPETNSDDEDVQGSSAPPAVPANDRFGGIPNPPNGGINSYMQFRRHFKVAASTMHELFCDKKLLTSTVETTLWYNAKVLVIQDLAIQAGKDEQSFDATKNPEEGTSSNGGSNKKPKKSGARRRPKPKTVDLTSGQKKYVDEVVETWKKLTELLQKMESEVGKVKKIDTQENALLPGFLDLQARASRVYDANRQLRNELAAKMDEETRQRLEGIKKMLELNLTNSRDHKKMKEKEVKKWEEEEARIKKELTETYPLVQGNINLAWIQPKKASKITAALTKIATLNEQLEEARFRRVTAKSSLEDKDNQVQELERELKSVEKRLDDNA